MVAGNEVLLVNKADFTKEPFDFLPRLLFVVVGNQDPATLIAQKKNEGWAFLSDSQIYVEGALERVMIFARQRS